LYKKIYEELFIMAAPALKTTDYLTCPDAIASPIALLNEEKDAQELLRRVAALHGRIQLDVSSSFPQEICWVPQRKRIEINAVVYLYHLSGLSPTRW